MQRNPLLRHYIDVRRKESTSPLVTELLSTVSLLCRENDVDN